MFIIIGVTLSTRKIDKAVTPMIMIMQRLHENDPTGHILSKKKLNVRHICLPGEIKNYRKSLKPAELADKYVDDLLDPVRMNWKTLKDLEADLGQYGYAGQIGQSPAPPQGGMFKVDHINIVDTLPPENVSGIVRAWDKAGTMKGGAYTVGLKLYRYANGRFIVADVVRGQWSSEEREDIIRHTARADGKEVMICIEQEPGSGGKESAEATVRNLAGYSVRIDRPTGDKVYRADPVSVQVNSGNVALLRGDWNAAFVEELRNFPYGTYKDQVDALSMAFHQLVHRKHAGPIVRRY
jgi:predicted phage terminase large subunit-like protein